MTNQQINKIRDCLAAILEQAEMLSYYGALLEQRKPRLEEIEGRVLRIRDVLFSCNYATSRIYVLSGKVV